VSARIGILGGTLDPIHGGHLEAAIAVRDALQLTDVRILPSRVPPHRAVQPVASAYHRFAMAAISVNGVEGLTASDAELSVSGPSYTADTLDRMRQSGLDGSQIFFITGADAFAEIATWHRYPEVLNLAHFVVVSRPGHAIDDLRRRLPALSSHMRSAADVMGVAHSIPSRFSNPSTLSILLVEATTPDVSSTGIRERLHRGESVRGLLPAAVERHIQQHGLYRGDVRAPADLRTADQLHGED
jgi:nicotinate-nucleotide adenylyltransferase